MEFLHIPEDILNYNLAFYDVHSAISLGQTNRYLHSLVFCHSTWVTIVEHLQYRGFVDLLSPADIRAMSMDSLVTLVKPIILGPTTWSPRQSTEARPNRSTLFRRMVDSSAGSSPGLLASPNAIHAKPKLRKRLDKAELPAPLSGTAAELLPGGQYLLYHRTHNLECWRVLDGTMVWQHQSNLPDARVLYFGAQLLDSGEHLNLVTCVQTSLDWSIPFVQIVTLDLAAGVAETVSSFAVRRARFTPLSSRCPRIFDGFGTVKMSREEELYVIINWRTHQYCEIVGGSHLALHLIPGHFVLASTSTPTGKVTISLFSMEHLSPYWLALGTDTPNNAVDVSHFPHACSQIIGIFPTLLGRQRRGLSPLVVSPLSTAARARQQSCAPLQIPPCTRNRLGSDLASGGHCSASVPNAACPLALLFRTHAASAADHFAR
ncbi:hypothetical protein FB45DRAFT_922895 [Roridomyces roridus]|uniref:F-box domain-containing protein n=1 Tax=Roridomyces roridus TaxID=1738132 RepID=A0AAD7BNX7_9AGAR|nr:hypothetical protein FB45DRAFT_922895 [Roridomyces roridus]